MRITLVSTYPPRACGIGTFSRDLRSAMVPADPDVDVDVLAIVRDPHQAQLPEVLSVIRQDVRADYVAAPALLVERGTDVVVIEHEYGIFGGSAGDFLLSLVSGLQVPYVIPLHTVLTTPSAEQAAVLTELCRQAALVTVFTETARRLVVEGGVVAPEKVRVVPHGAPTALLPSSQPAAGSSDKSPLPHLTGRTVLSTFGLISASKGIETVLEALPAVVAAHPDVLYLIAGQTHPEVIRNEGEQYRLSLQRLVRDRGLQRHVQFLDRFLTTEDLAVLLSSTDLYLTPYRAREQIVSGALTFAVVAGCPVVSTSYLYAEDLLTSGAGILVPFDDPAAFAAGILHFLDDPDALAAAAATSRSIGAQLAWPTVGKQMVGVLIQAQRLDRAAEQPAGPLASSPPVRADHLRTLVDDVGIVQHADGTIPYRDSGYCVDDAARLVVVAVGLEGELDDGTFGRMATLGLSFLRHAWVPSVDGLRNFMSYERQWLDEPHLGDHVGRTVWALGTVFAAHPPRAVAVPSLRMLEQLAPMVVRLTSPRAMAFAVIGLTKPPLSTLPAGLAGVLTDLSDRLLQGYLANARPGWWWAEDELTYDNARLPQALILAGHRLSRPDMVAAGVQALDWYWAQCVTPDGDLRLIGHRWRRHDQAVGPASAEGGAEQPVDAAALVECLSEALTVTGRQAYGDQAVRAFEWFLGRNRLGQPLYDFASGGCRDGIEWETVSENEGAESTLAYFQAMLALESVGLQGSLPEP